MRTRICAVALIKNENDEYLLLKMPQNFGAYPGQWGIIGGGIDDGETAKEALEREVREEAGLKVISATPLFFADDKVNKLLRDGTQEQQYIIFLLYEVTTTGETIINDEWETFEWVHASELKNYDFNRITKENLERLGLLK